MVQDDGTGSWWWRNIIAREHHRPIVDHHLGPRGGEGEGGSRRAGEQLHPAPTWEQESSSIPPRHGSTEDGGWRITGWKMIVSQPGGRSRWHVVMEYYCHIIGMEYYCNIIAILLQYYCEGISMLGQTVPPCDSMFHGPCSMVHVPWSATEPLPFPSSSSSPTSTASSSSPTSTSSSSPSPSPTWNPNPGNPNPDVEP
jgi:hypothetical protein